MVQHVACAAGALIRMMVPIAAISAFLNNTPVVAIMIPILLAWSAKAGLAPGHLFMPLSFASILGGTVTLIGTCAAKLTAVRR
jgi:Na+/H+ antiporter NhaD/arsenite permease-like protein